MTSFAAPMKTELSSFCREYSQLLLPLRRELGKSIELIRDQQETDDIKEILSSLCDAHHRLKNLAEKIDSQQAYVIIFGPLKSGKSTLINAFTGAYVSEVTSLPAYPCLVHVRHEEEVSLTASRFNGQTERFEDFGRMKSAVEVYHRELAEHIREVEDQEETFEPGIHFPEAIRRLDIGLPAEPLKESYTILVDTPGLYSRMKFGYDLMTREFRDSAACAVFVVKTDNLFLEQVFEEFNDLLDLFTRIFLVVNIDGHKRDLEADGELRPSLESREPQKIIDAFCSLSMSAPLRHAYEQGRLKIYPIDLLKAAGERLAEGAAQSAGEETGERPEETGENGEEPVAEDAVDADKDFDFQPAARDVQNVESIENFSPPAGDVGSGNFNEFMADLTNYLNSNDYIIHFMRDSLRQGRQLIEEIEQGCREENLKSFLIGTKALQADYDRESDRRQAFLYLRDLNWEEAFAGVRKRIKENSKNFVQTEQKRVETELKREVDEWFTATESLKQLLDERINPVFERLPVSFRQFVFERIQNLTNNSFAGAELHEAGQEKIEKVDLSFGVIRSEALDAAQVAGENVSTPGKGFSAEAMPVRRRFWDWLLLRRMNSIRAKIFGSDDDKTITLKVKQSRLGEKSKQDFCANLRQYLRDAFAHLSREMLDPMVNTYISGAKNAADDALKRGVEDLNQRLPRLKSRIQARHEVHETIENLASLVDVHDRELASLEDTFSCRHPDPGEENEENSESDLESEGTVD